MPEIYAKWNGVGFLPCPGQEHLTEKLAIGEVYRMKTYDTKARSAKLNARHFALLNYLFNYVEGMSFDSFREWATIGAGFFEIAPDQTLVARSIAFRNMSEDTFRDLHKRTMDWAIEKMLPDTVGPERLQKEVETFINTWG